MELKNRTLSNFAELVKTGECKKFRGRLKTGIDLGTANTVLAVVDRNNRPIAGISAPSHAIPDGVIVNYYESVQLVTKLKNELEEKLGTELLYGAAAIPPGVSEGSIKSIGYVLEGAGFEVTNIVDEPTAAAAVLKITDGAVVDVDVEAETDVDKRVQIIENRMAYEKNPGYFCRKYKESQEELSERIRSAREFLPTVRVPKELLRLAAQICVAYGTDGHRADIGMIRTAQTIAALEGRKKASREDLERAARYVLPHRMRKNPLEDGQMDPQVMEEILSAGKKSSREPEASGEGD